MPNPAAQARLRAAALMPNLHTLLRRRFPQALWQGDPGRREIALTFDDGPHPRDTPCLLEVLAKHDIKATFFSVGSQVELHSDLTRAVATAGHQIGIHGYRHRAFLLERPAALHSQLAFTQQLIATAVQRTPATIRDVRPPFGIFTPATLRRLISWGYRPVMWSLVPLHWLQPAETTIRQVTRQVRAGSLLVLHERLPGPPVAALADSIVARLKAADFQFATVEEMWRAQPAYAG